MTALSLSPTSPWTSPGPANLSEISNTRALLAQSKSESTTNTSYITGWGARNFFASFSNRNLFPSINGPTGSRQKLSSLDLGRVTTSIDPRTSKVTMLFGGGDEMALDAVMKELRARNIIADGCRIVIENPGSGPLQPRYTEYLKKVEQHYNVKFELRNSSE